MRQSFGGRGDEISRLRDFERRVKVLVRRVLRAPAEIRRDRSFEKLRGLRRDSKRRPQRRETIFAHVATEDLDRSFRRVVEARDQVRERRLARPDPADDPDRLSDLNVERDSVQRLPRRAGVRQRNVLERNGDVVRPRALGEFKRSFDHILRLVNDLGEPS